MPSEPSPAPSRYNGFTIALHWIVAALVFAQIALGWWMIEVPKEPPGQRVSWFNLHKSVGLTIGMLVLVRLGWRMRHSAPASPRSLPRWQVIAARANHALLYVCMLVMPLSGYLGSSFTKYPIRYFGTVIPKLGWESELLKELCSQVHFVTIWVFMILIAIHIAAALKYLLVGRDGVFDRIVPWRSTAARLWEIKP